MYYQQQLWIQAPFRDATLEMNTESYGFVRKENLTVPDIVISKPEGLPDPCTCGKCACLQEWMSMQDNWDQVLQVLQMQGK